MTAWENELRKEPMEQKNIAIVGTGLIGGSLALRLRETGLANRLIGVDASAENCQVAVERGLVDECAEIHDAVDRADVVVLAIPVDQIVGILPGILDRVDQQIITDLGSTKSQLAEVVKNHPKRGRYVAAHPMWGTEYSGPAAAVPGAFTNKAVILCNTQESDADALAWVRGMFATIGMHQLFMDANDHDLHAAYVSHISHITSFALANTVLEKEKEDNAIFEMASAGFESTVRLAKSNPKMWVPVFKQNKENVLDVLNEHISQLRKFKSCLEKENWSYLEELITDANKIKRIIK
jgi:prephenate dehydrogenase